MNIGDITSYVRRGRLLQSELLTDLSIGKITAILIRTETAKRKLLVINKTGTETGKGGLRKGRRDYKPYRKSAMSGTRTGTDMHRRTSRQGILVIHRIHTTQHHQQGPNTQARSVETALPMPLLEESH
jgi:hypothetical protein